MQGKTDKNLHFTKILSSLAEFTSYEFSQNEISLLLLNFVIKAKIERGFSLV
jgi:hypothetical protein